MIPLSIEIANGGTAVHAINQFAGDLNQEEFEELELVHVAAIFPL